jgi:hypothetical protein
VECCRIVDVVVVVLLVVSVVSRVVWVGVSKRPYGKLLLGFYRGPTIIDQSKKPPCLSSLVRTGASTA